MVNVANGGAGLGEQAKLAQQVRAFHTNPAHPVFKLANPTEFDRMMLSLFDSMERDVPEIDDKIDGLGSYLRQKGFFRAYGDRFKVDSFGGGGPHFCSGHVRLQKYGSSDATGIDCCALRMWDLGGTKGTL